MRRHPPRPARETTSRHPPRRSGRSDRGYGAVHGEDPRRPRTPRGAPRQSRRGRRRGALDLSEAEAVVWAGPETELGELPDGVKWVQLQSAGIEPWVERIRDTPDVQFTSAVGAYATQVAEHALALLLAGTRGIHKYARDTSWDPEDERVLEGSTVAIIGAGGIGRELITMLEPHDVEIIAVTRSGRDGTLPVDAAARGLGQGRPLRDLRARDRRHGPPRRRGRARADEAALAGSSTSPAAR